MKLLKALPVIGLASILLASTLADNADARRTRRTTNARQSRSSNVSQIIDFTLFDTGEGSDFFYEAKDGGSAGNSIESSSGGSLLTFGSNAPKLDSSGNLTLNILFEDVIDGIDVQLGYEFTDVFSVVPELQDDLSVQNILDFFAVGNVNGFDIFDDIDEGFAEINNRSVLGEDENGNLTSFLRFVRAEETGGDLIFNTLEGDDRDTIRSINSEYETDESLFINGEPFNDFGAEDTDVIEAFGVELVDVPEPGTLGGLFLLISTGLGRALFLRKRQA